MHSQNIEERDTQALLETWSTWEQDVIYMLIQQMGQKTYFNICALDKISGALGAPFRLNKKNQSYRMLGALHCVHYDSMPPAVLNSLPDVIWDELGLKQTGPHIFGESRWQEIATEFNESVKKNAELASQAKINEFVRESAAITTHAPLDEPKPIEFELLASKEDAELTNQAQSYSPPIRRRRLLESWMVLAAITASLVWILFISDKHGAQDHSEPLFNLESNSTSDAEKPLSPLTAEE